MTTTARTPPSTSARTAWLALASVYLLWGSIYLFNRLVITHVRPLLAGGFRFLAAGAVLTLMVLVVSGPSGLRMSRAALGTSLLSAALLPAWGNGLVGIAQQHVASGLAALLLAVVPLYIVILRVVTGDRPRVATLAGVALGLAGLAVLVLAGTPAGSGGTVGHAWWGPWLVLLAGLGWATGTFATTRMATPPNPFALAAVQMTIGGVLMLALGFAVGDRMTVAEVPAGTWWVWVAAAAATLGGFSGYAIALRGLPVSTVATYAYVNPIVAVVLGTVVVGERFTPVQAVGGVVVLLAVVVVVASERSGTIRRPVAVLDRC